MESTPELMGLIRGFMSEREWNQFHSPENLAKSISIEAAELLQEFQWGAPPDFANVKHELADVLTYCLLLADALNVNPEAIVRDKLEITRAKYPVDTSRGSSARYDQLDG